ncbi:MAG: hypothetical protein IBJ03_16720 [Gemmatimonadaceae bacterium]|nr:hypothetical protein [Gemmatimonadaceae bacterium]
MSAPAFAALAMIGTLSSTSHAQGGGTNGTIKACWVEGSGVIYRRDTTGAPAACTRATHRPIEWPLGTIPAFTLPVPMALSGSSPSPILSLTQTGNSNALLAKAGGTTAVARLEKTEGAGAALVALNLSSVDGQGVAIVAQGQGSQATAQLQNIGVGGALNARSNSVGPATIIAANTATDQGQALYAESKGTNTTISAINNGTTGGAALYAKSSTIYSTASLQNDNATGNGNALYGESKSAGYTGQFQNSGTVGGALSANSNASFTTGYFGSNATGSNARALFADSKGGSPTITATNTGTANGAAVQGLSQGNNSTGDFRNSSTTGSGGALYLENNSSGHAVSVYAKGGGTALYTSSSAQNGVFFENTGTGTNIAVLGRSRGIWPTAQFENTSTGAALRTVGSAIIVGDFRVDGNAQINGNYVATGTKNAVVPTSSGTREMYTEEATEVWFADYGQSTIRDSVVWVPFDGIFAETIESNRPYHVFLQAYADASLYVSRRTAEGFEVRLAGDRAPAQPIDFSYRLVAKRRGYGDRRLKPHALDTAAETPQASPSGVRK